MSLRFNAEAYDKLFPRQKPEPKIEKSCEMFNEEGATESSDIEGVEELPEDIETEGGVTDGLGASSEPCT